MQHVWLQHNDDSRHVCIGIQSSNSRSNPATKKKTDCNQPRNGAVPRKSVCSTSSCRCVSADCSPRNHNRVNSGTLISNLLHHTTSNAGHERRVSPLPRLSMRFAVLAPNATTSQAVQWLATAVSNITSGATQSTKSLFATPAIATVFVQLAANATTAESVQWLSLAICNITRRDGTADKRRVHHSGNCGCPRCSCLQRNYKPSRAIFSRCDVQHHMRTTQSTKDAFATPSIVNAFAVLACKANTADSVQWLAAAIATSRAGRRSPRKTRSPSAAIVNAFAVLAPKASTAESV